MNARKWARKGKSSKMLSHGDDTESGICMCVYVGVSLFTVISNHSNWNTQVVWNWRGKLQFFGIWLQEKKIPYIKFIYIQFGGRIICTLHDWACHSHIRTNLASSQSHSTDFHIVSTGKLIVNMENASQ